MLQFVVQLLIKLRFKIQNKSSQLLGVGPVNYRIYRFVTVFGKQKFSSKQENNVLSL